MVVSLLLALVADAPGHAPALRAAEGASIAAHVVVTVRADLVDHVFPRIDQVVTAAHGR